MKATQQLIAATLAVFAAAAGASEATPYPADVTAGASKSRAEVQAELAQAMKDGSVQFGEISRGTDTRIASQKSRQEVRAEVLAAMARGELREVNGEPYIDYMPNYKPFTPAFAKAASNVAQ